MPSKKTEPPSAPLVRVVEVEAPTLAPEQLPSLLREINDRQFGAVLEVLLEAKFKAEAILRNDSIYESPGKVAFYSGWCAYSDYIVSNLVGLRSGPGEGLPAEAPHEGPPED